MSSVERASPPPSSALRGAKSRAALLAHLVKIGGMRVLEVASMDGWGSMSSTRPSEPDFVMTFDDGPTPSRTVPILRALQEHDATATFFVLMRNARAHPDLLERLLKHGHEVALHGADHRPLRNVEPGQLAEVLGQAKEDLEQQIGRPVRWYRPPYGEFTVPTWRVVKSLGLAPVLWSRTSWDWKHTDQRSRLTVACMRRRPGTVVLAHDGHAGIEDGARPAVEPVLDRYELTSRILDAYAAKGITSRTLGEVLRSGKAVNRPHFLLGGSRGSASHR